jgi:lipoate-protein ligase A
VSGTGRAEPWRLITTWDAEPGFNMALDEALLDAQDERATLRLYTWQPEALSLGYFQRWADVQALAAGLCCVRRMTGGGAIHHRDELTFSIVAPREHWLYRGEIRDSYARVHEMIAEALSGLGLRASLREERALLSDVPGSAMCFHASTPLDLIWDGAKGVGSAQRRRGSRVLHHGSIKIGSTRLEGPIATLREHAPELTPQLFAKRLLATMEASFGARLVEDELARHELERARERAGFFRSEAFLRRR